MQFTVETVINVPLLKVVEMFENPDNLSKWQPGFQSLEHVSRTKSKSGAVSKLKYQMGKRNIEMVETILENDLPKKFIATYEAKNVWNKIANEFIKIDENTTRYISHNECKFIGFMKIISWLMPNAFKKQSCQYLEQFKQFAESEK